MKTRLQPARVTGLRQEELLLSNYQIIQNEEKYIIFLLCLQFKIILLENSASHRKQGSTNRIASWTDRELFFPNFLNIMIFLLKKNYSKKILLFSHSNVKVLAIQLCLTL